MRIMCLKISGSETGTVHLHCVCWADGVSAPWISKPQALIIKVNALTQMTTGNMAIGQRAKMLNYPFNVNDLEFLFDCHKCKKNIVTPQKEKRNWKRA